MDPENGTAENDKGIPPVDRPLPPPPTTGELFDIFRQRLALRHPRFDPTRMVLVVAALVGLGGMAWAVWTPRSGTSQGPPVSVVATTSTTSTLVAATTTPAEFIVDVAGAVRSPGPVRVSHTGRVEDAIRSAGGVRSDADLERVDRAAPLVDGQRIYVPTKGQIDIPEVVGATGAPPPSPSGPSSPAGSSATSPAAQVNVNSADETELVTLSGVGPATAQAIIDHRDANGPFAAVDDLLEVKGIGPAKMENLRPHVTV